MKDYAIQLSNGSTGITDLAIKVVRDADNKILSGLVIGNTLRQNQAIILIAEPGELKFNPTVGVGITDLLLDNDYLRMRHRIREHLAKDGMKVKSLDFAENRSLKIDAIYE